MALVTFKDTDIQFDPAFISADDIAELRTSFTPETLGADQEETLDTFGLPSVDTYDEAREQVKRMMEADGFLADMLAEAQQDGEPIDIDDVLADMDAQLKPVLERGELPAEAIHFAEEGVKFAQFIDTDTGSTLIVDNQEVLRIGRLGGAKDKNVKVAAATVVVVIDLIFVILALSSVKAARTRKADEAMGKAAKKSINPMKKLAKELLKRLAGAMRKFRDKDKPKKTVVRDVISDIAKAVAHAMKQMWNDMWGDIKRILKALLSSIKAIVTAIASLTATILLAIGTAGAALVASLINLTLALVKLIDDTISLKAAMDGA